MIMHIIGLKLKKKRKSFIKTKFGNIYPPKTTLSTLSVPSNSINTKSNSIQFDIEYKKTHEITWKIYSKRM